MIATSIDSMLAARPHPPLQWPTLWRLAVMGALVGSIIGAALLAVWWGEPLGVAGIADGIATGLALGAPFGAVCGLVGAPVAGLLVLRPVPLWLAILSPSIGALVGGSVGLVNTLWMALDVLGPDPISGAATGFLLGTFVARPLAKRWVGTRIGRSPTNTPNAS